MKIDLKFEVIDSYEGPVYTSPWSWQKINGWHFITKYMPDLKFQREEMTETLLIMLIN